MFSVFNQPGKLLIPTFRTEDIQTLSTMSWQKLDVQNCFSESSDENYDNTMDKHDFKIKIKTEICKYWCEDGYCPFGAKCAFAHGTEEIRTKVHVHSKYKTKICRNFREQGFCSYGVRCQFQHNQSSQPKLPNLFYQRTLDGIQKFKEVMVPNFKRRCESFKKLTL